MYLTHANAVSQSEISWSSNSICLVSNHQPIPTWKICCREISVGEVLLNNSLFQDGVKFQRVLFRWGWIWGCFYPSPRSVLPSSWPTGFFGEKDILRPMNLWRNLSCEISRFFSLLISCTERWKAGRMLEWANLCAIVFQEGIEPMWEDEKNRLGGRWLINLNKNARTSELDKIWLEMVSIICVSQNMVFFNCVIHC